ncbi:hypothetical protein, partial [Sphingorhabdus sp.]|uniref:hypothetical protein n=1 Tax=Sphingorhabdus sp. TaxID=1902408 RepID=UPI002FDCEEA5
GALQGFGGKGGGSGILGAIGGAMNAGEEVTQQNELYQTLIANEVEPRTAQLMLKQPAAYKVIEAIKEKNQKVAREAEERTAITQFLTKRHGLSSQEALAISTNPAALQKYFEPEANVKGSNGPYKDAKQLADVEEGVRKEYSTVAKPYFEVRDSYARVEQSAAKPSPAGDLAMIFNYMKMLDPGSVVREAEFATAAQTGSYGEIIKARVTKVLNGELLTPDQRADFVNQARGLYQRQNEQYSKIQKQYEGVAQRLGIRPENVILDYQMPETPKAEALTEGGAALQGQAGRQSFFKSKLNNEDLKKIIEQGVK